MVNYLKISYTDIDGEKRSKSVIIKDYQSNLNVELTELQDGALLTNKEDGTIILYRKVNDNHTYFYAYIDSEGLLHGLNWENVSEYYYGYLRDTVPSTPEETERFMRHLEKKGKRWDAETKSFENI